MKIQNLMNLDMSNGISKKCWKCEGIMKSERNICYDLISGKYEHKKCNRFHWKNRNKYPDLWAEELGRRIGLK